MATSKSEEVIAVVGNRVQLVFDTWTPRPHFIVVQSQPKADASNEEFKASFELIGNFLTSNPLYETEAILSFHRGKWYQKHTGKWHAHLCVPFKPYLDAAKEKITNITDNKEWRGAKTVVDGMNNWRLRKIQEYTNYKNDCIRQRISGETSAESCRLSTFDAHFTDYKLVWTYPAPRIGIIAISPGSSTLASLYNFMSQILENTERELSQRDSSFRNFGCHLCLYVRGQSGINVTCRTIQIFTEDGRSTENSNAVGYIQLDESQYVRWLPSNIRQLWLETFKSANHFVET